LPHLGIKKTVKYTADTKQAFGSCDYEYRAVCRLFRSFVMEGNLIVLMCVGPFIIVITEE